MTKEEARKFALQWLPAWMRNKPEDPETGNITGWSNMARFLRLILLR